MARITIHSIIRIPELTACLSVYLTTSDIAHAMATCKAWSEQFQPFLWANLRIRRMLPGKTMLEQNLHRICTIDLNLQFIPSNGAFGSNPTDIWATLSHGLLLPSAACASDTVTDRASQLAAEARARRCTNLRRIKAVLYRSLTQPLHSFRIYLAPLLRNNSNNLTHLYLDFYDFTPPSLKEEFSALCSLRHLTIHADMLEESWFLSLLQACLPLPRLSELYCYFAIRYRDYAVEGYSEGGGQGVDDVAEPRGELKTILEDAIAARTSETGSMGFTIKALRFPDPMEGDILKIVLPMLRSALVEIETLEVPELCNYRPDRFYEELVRKYCPRLRHLIIPPYYAEDHPAAVCSFIRGAVGLKTVRGTHFSDGCSPISPSMMQVLIMCHSKTLEELELLDCVMLMSSDQQDVLASCKKLKRFWVLPQRSIEGEHRLRSQDIVVREWGCVQLKELCLTLNRRVGYKSAKLAMQREMSASGAQELLQESRQEEEQERQMKAWEAKRVFMQIGRLVVLETLSLGTDESVYGREEDSHVSEWELTLSKGWLAELAGLKNLRHLHLRTDYWSEMGQAEVEFMDAKWSLLGEISFDLKKSELCDLVKQPHWQWLQQKRSELRLSALHL